MNSNKSKTINKEEKEDLLINKTKMDGVQRINYEAFISCLADLIRKSIENKDIDKHFI